MLLGGLAYLIPVIKAAHDRGYRVITVDYLPNNIAHKYSDEYYNISTFDKEAILETAQRIKIDGIMSFAVDAGVVSAAYVAEKMGLPFQCGYESASILQDKSLFRKFLAENGFNTPKAKGYSNIEDALCDADLFNWPVIIKPVDSCGSKGVTRVDNKNNLADAIQRAVKISVSNSFIIEDFLPTDVYPSGSESFFVDGELKYNAFYDQVFDHNAPNPYVPASECWPCSKDEEVLLEVRRELQRLGDLLGFRTGLFNVEWRLSDRKMYLMEVSPRAGGNRLAELLNYATDVDIIKAELDKTIGLPCDDVHEPAYNGCYAIFNIHSDEVGIFDGLEIDPIFEKHYIVDKELRVCKGDRVERFTGANSSIGTMFLKTTTRKEMDDILAHIYNKVRIKIS